MCSKFSKYCRFKSQHNWRDQYNHVRKKIFTLIMLKYPQELKKLRGEWLQPWFGFANHLVLVTSSIPKEKRGKLERPKNQSTLLEKELKRNLTFPDSEHYHKFKSLNSKIRMNLPGSQNNQFQVVALHIIRKECGHVINQQVVQFSSKFSQKSNTRQFALINVHIIITRFFLWSLPQIGNAMYSESSSRWLCVKESLTCSQQGNRVAFQFMPPCLAVNLHFELCLVW